MRRNYEALVSAIIRQAASDYMSASRKLDDPDEKKQKDAQIEMDGIERFFGGMWFSSITDLDGEYLLNRIRKETGCRRAA